MPEIKFFNSATRKKEVFAPLRDQIGIYLCGPTVYDRAHLGNARGVIVFDILSRMLRREYPGHEIRYVRNITDIDDKINETAKARKAKGDPRSVEELIAERADETVAWYRTDMAALGALPPDFEPRATDFIPQMIEMIDALIAKGAAYAAEGHVLFHVDAYPGYGQLSGRSVEDMIAGARVEVAPYKKNPMDFVLWKPSDAETPGWESPWGRGRPGWHIECSAMSKALLGESFDIHGGGLDLQFPHHENEIAQSKCLCGEESFARVWLHNEMLQVEGRKMSKSLGNFFTVRDLLDEGVPGEVIRFVFLMTHYSKPMDWTEGKRAEAEATLRKWRAMTEGIEPSAIAAPVSAALRDDLNTPGALAALHALAAAGDGAGLKASAGALGLLGSNLAGWDKAGDDVAALIEQLLEARVLARKARDFARADAIRDGFLAAGVEVKDSAEGTSWALKPGFDAAKLEGLVR